MKGHVRERGPGHWYAVIELRDPATGKRKRKWHSLPDCKGKREAQVACAKIIASIENQSYLEPSKTTLAEYLERWLAHVKSQVSPRTHERYVEICRKNITPLLGATVLRKLRPAAISAAWSKALQEGHRNAQRGLSARTVSHIHTVLKNALGQAVRWELLARNPSNAVDPPRIERKPMLTYDLAQTAKLLDAIREHQIFVPVILATLCGLRRGEICALRWKNIDLQANSHPRISVTQSAEQTRSGIRYKPPKNGRTRTVAMSETVVEEVRKHRLKQAQELLRLGVRQTDETLVCTLADGSPLRPNTLTIYWRELVGKVHLSRIRFHDLRQVMRYSHAGAGSASENSKRTPWPQSRGGDARSLFARDARHAGGSRCAGG